MEQYYADFFPDFDRERFLILTQKLGLTDNPKVRNLSSGSGAKLRIAAALSRKAELFLLDEPLNGIDSKAREEIISLIPVSYTHLDVYKRQEGPSSVLTNSFLI